MTPKLSICIATYNRGSFISETLESILSQITDNVEIIVVDGASPDNTSEIMADYVSSCPQLKYFRESENSGVDADFDKAVSYATGEYCWLMADDDLLFPGALNRVLISIPDDTQLLVVDAEIRNADLSEVLEESRTNLKVDRLYKKGQHEDFFVDMASHLSFIGCVIIRRDIWLSRQRAPYYGTLFIHIGVIFQHPPLDQILVISKPAIIIRYGNAMWTPRAFEIWMFKWPNLIWSFPDFSEKAKQTICKIGSWTKIKHVFHYRAKGAYSALEFKKHFYKEENSFLRVILYLIAIFPSKLANFLSAIYVLKNKSKRLVIYDLKHSPCASFLSHYLNRKLSN